MGLSRFASFAVWDGYRVEMTRATGKAAAEAADSRRV
jgi:hypothetical protein